MFVCLFAEKKHLLERISTPTELHTYFVFLTINQCSIFSTTNTEKIKPSISHTYERVPRACSTPFKNLGEISQRVEVLREPPSLFTYGMLSFTDLSLVPSMADYMYFRTSNFMHPYIECLRKY